MFCFLCCFVLFGLVWFGFVSFCFVIVFFFTKVAGFGIHRGMKTVIVI